VSLLDDPLTESILTFDVLIGDTRVAIAGDELLKSGETVLPGSVKGVLPIPIGKSFETCCPLSRETSGPMSGALPRNPRS
jgi:hypothetical protein